MDTHKEEVDSSDEEISNVFQEPEDYYKPPPQPTVQKYTRKQNSEEITLHLLGTHPLWGHLLWNAAVVISDVFDAPEFPMAGRYVLELGAGAALPSIVAIKAKAAKVVITDYPDEDLMANIQKNVDLNTNEEERGRVGIEGHLWGTSVEKLLKHLPEGEKFDLIILSDLIFNHTKHYELLLSSQNALRDNGEVYVSFTHHRPHKAEMDMKFFSDAAKEPFNFKVEHMFDKRMGPMFERDFGSEEVRSIVHVYKLTKTK